MRIYEINDLSNTKVVEILKTGINEKLFKNEKQIENYLYSHKENAANLFYRLDNKEYKTGGYFVMTDDDDKYIASAGWYRYNSKISLAMTRMLIIPEYRTKYIFAPKVLPKMIDNSDCEYVWMTFNEYNKTIYNWFERVHQGKSSAIGNSTGANWPAIYKKFKPIGKKIVNGMEQYVVEFKK